MADTAGLKPMDALSPVPPAWPPAPPPPLPATPGAALAAPPEAQVAQALRTSLMPVLQALGGQPTRPMHLVRRIGLDKSLASRLAQASRADTEAEFLHRLPSPTGLRILIDRSRQAGLAEAWLPALAQAVDDFAQLLDGLPGGRQALDARLGSQQHTIRARREQMARQASFKAVSFLFGHDCDCLTTSLFLLPSADGQAVDVIEVHRRLGLRRITPGTAVPLLSVHASAGAGAAPSAMTPVGAPPAGTAAANEAHRYLISEASSQPLPELDIVQDGPNRVFVLGPAAADPLPARLSTALRLEAAEMAHPGPGRRLVRNYMLHTPCQRLVREVFLADGVWPAALPEWGFFLPGPSGGPMQAPDPAQPHFRRLNLSAPLLQLPQSADLAPLDGVPDHAAALWSVLQRAGLAGTHFRGWRCEIAYPVPLVEMQLSFRFGPDAPGRTG